MKIDIRIEGDLDQSSYLKWWFTEGGGINNLEKALRQALSGQLTRDYPIEELELNVRAYNCLKVVGIETVSYLVTLTENHLARIPNLGRKSVEEIKEALAEHGLSLRKEEVEPTTPLDAKELGDFASAAVAKFQRVARQMDPQALKHYIENPEALKQVLEEAFADNWNQEKRNQQTLEALHSLPERDRRVLELRFGVGGKAQTFKAIAAEIGCSTSYARYLVYRATELLAENHFKGDWKENEERLFQPAESRKKL